ncbi:MAG: AAA family ATPase [Collinsella sp.]
MVSEQANYGDTAYYGVELINRSGNGALPVGEHDFAEAMDRCVLVDKTMFIADVLDADASVVACCRPEGFGKSMNLSMLRAFLEQPTVGQVDRGLFAGPRFGMRVAGAIGMSLAATL